MWKSFWCAVTCAVLTVVIVTVFAFAAYFYVVDAVLSRAIQSLLHWLGGVQ